MSGVFDAMATTRSLSGSHTTTALWPTSPPPPAAPMSGSPKADSSNATQPGVSDVPSPWSNPGVLRSSAASGEMSAPVNSAWVHAARSSIVMASAPLPSSAQWGPSKSPA
jgi:hypothetical protein